jgi:hypothetical protein
MYKLEILIDLPRNTLVIIPPEKNKKNKKNKNKKPNFMKS